MNEIQFIVSRLNSPPFSMNMRLVDFDEKSPLALVQSLNDVLGEMDESMKGDVRDEDVSVRGLRIGAFLQMLNVPQSLNGLAGGSTNSNNPNANSEEERLEFLNNLSQGKKTYVYPVLHYILSNFERLSLRAYLGKYLVRIEPPAEFLNDDTLNDLVTRYRELQQEFKSTHKTYDGSKATMSRPVAELKQEINQLEDERRQLQERISRLQQSTRNEANFPAMLSATSAMRQEQDEEVRLSERMREQRHMLDLAEQKCQDTMRRLNALKQSATGGHDAEAILRQLASDVDDTAKVIRHDMAQEKSRMEDAIKKLERQRLEPTRTIEDVERVRATVRGLERQRDEMREQVDKNMASRNDSKLAKFRQHANVASTKLNSKEDEVEARLRDLQAFKNEVEDLESKANDMAAASGGGMVGPNGPMSRDEEKAYGQQLREKARAYKERKEELQKIQQESVVLHRTEQILKGRDRNLDEFLKQEEAKAGVSGYRDAQSRLEMASEQTAEMDDMKGQTLDEISDLVKNINQKLEEKKTKLKPLIKELKDVRKQYQETEQTYLDKKKRYDSVAVGLATERSMLENECNELQDECLQEESRYHYLNCLGGIAAVNLEKVQMEEKWSNGNGRLLPDFKCFQDLYRNKISQQEALSKQLRKQQKKIKEGEGGNVYQRSLYADLHRLLSYKVKSKLGNDNSNNIFGISGQLTADTVDFGTAQVVRID
jgi:intraflagellar transport protein 81